MRDPSYYEFARPEVAAMIPDSARRVLDVGCGAGALGALLKTRQPAEVVGIEIEPEAASTARERLDEVLERDIEDPQLRFPQGLFDCIVCADVLEHIREPGSVLRRFREWLKPSGTLVVSVPNVRNHAVVRALAQGNWTYESAGLLDRDHLRFFTRREIEKLLYRSGFKTRSLQAVPGKGFSEWSDAGRPSQLDWGRLQVWCDSADDAAEWFAYQYLLSAEPEPTIDYPLTSIVVVTHNALNYTRMCLESVLERTDEPIELIFVDNGSHDGTQEYLRSIDGVRLVENGENRGFPAAANQGLQAARGEVLVLLNNDAIVTTGWLRCLSNALRSDPQIGLAGPCSNDGSGDQTVPVPYAEIASLDGFAWDWGKANQGVAEETRRLVGFCLAIKRAVIEKIGLLDERFGIGCFEDDDFTFRAIRAGFRAVIARDAFVHHFGRRTFAAIGMDYHRHLEENRQKYLTKWLSDEKGEQE